MSTSFASAAWPACHSALRLDRWIAGELVPAEAGEISAHVAACDRCRAAAEALRASRREALPPLFGAPRAARRAAIRPRLGPGLALVGGLAAAGLLLLVRAGDASRAPGGERTKGGGVSLGMWVQHGEAVRRAAPGEAVAPGDAVRFAVTTPAGAWVAVLSLDPAGRASVYFPAGPRAERVEAGADVPLPLATRLDGTIGREQVVGLFCDHPAAIEPVRAALERGQGAHGPAAPAGCQVTRWSFEKR
jgi:hypothetical protein